MTNYKLRMREKADALRAKGQARILAVESSCDETAIAIVENGRTVRANAIATQIDVHALYGGVVPEIASRMHVEAIDPLLDEALRQPGLTLDQIDAIAVTHGPIERPPRKYSFSPAPFSLKKKSTPMPSISTKYRTNAITSKFILHSPLETMALL